MTTTKSILHSALFALLFAMLLISAPFPQTIIKERVEVNPQKNSQQNPVKINSSVIPGGVVIPYNAKLKIYYASAEGIDLPVSTATELRMYFTTGDSVITDETLPRFSETYDYPDYILNICTSTFENHNRYFYYNSPQPYQTGTAAQNDTVLFAWYADSPWGYYEYPIYQITEIIVNNKLVGWDISFGSYEYCLQGWETKLDISVGLEEPIELDIQIDPPTVAISDTAEIIIKNKNADGTLTDFPAAQKFEIGMMEGCAAGKLHKAQVDTNYFYNITQPIYFIAADSLEGGDNDTVKVKVGLIEENNLAATAKLLASKKSLIAKTEFLEKIKNNKDEKAIVEPKIIVDKNKRQPTPFNTEANYCFYPGSFITTDVVKEKIFETGCDFESCGDSYDNIQIEVVRQYNNFETGFFQFDTAGNKTIITKINTVCFTKDSLGNTIPDTAIGQSRPIGYYRERKNQSGVYEYAWHLKPCKDSSDKIELRPVLADSVTPTPIYIDFLADVCYTTISNDGLTLITDTTQLSNTVLMPDTNRIIRDLCGHLCYPQRIGQFVFKEIIEQHELLHIEHFKKILADFKQDSLITELKKWVSYDCYNYTVQKKIKSLDGSFDSALGEYFSKAIRKYESDFGHTVDSQGKPHTDENTKLSQERKIHYVPAIRNLVLDYFDALHNARGTISDVINCPTCPQ